MSASTRAFQEIAPDLFLWTGDTCNVYVIRDGHDAILVDIGSGAVLDELRGIDVERVEWVLFTQHHREQTQGASRLPSGTEIIVSARERALFADPMRFRSRELTPGPYTVGGAYYVRLPRQPVPVSRSVTDGDLLTWRGQGIEVYETAGASPGAVTYVLNRNGARVAFCGNVCLTGGRLYRLFDSEWDYGYAGGFQALLASQHLLRRLNLAILCPAHGPVVNEPQSDLASGCERLTRFVVAMLRDYTHEDAAMAFAVSDPTASPGLRRVSPHLFSLRTTKGHNAYILLSETGKALFVDCGIFLGDREAEDFLDAKLAYLKNACGLSGVDAVVVSHYHGDHLRQIPRLVRRYGAQVWAFENCVDVIDRPDAYNLTWMLPAYGDRPGTMGVHRTLRDEELVSWHEYRFLCFHCPGQTEYALGLIGEIDGRRVAFTGDNVFLSANGSGHDAYSMFNSGGVMERGYLATAHRLVELNPELILGGHAQEIPDPGAQLKRLATWARSLREQLGEITVFDAYEYAVDPFWARFEPFRRPVRPAATARLTLHVRNYKNAPAALSAELRLPAGWTVSPTRIAGRLPAGASGAWTVEVTPPADARGVYVITADLTLDDARIGEFPEAFLLAPES